MARCLFVYVLCEVSDSFAASKLGVNRTGLSTSPGGEIETPKREDINYLKDLALNSQYV